MAVRPVLALVVGCALFAAPAAAAPGGGDGVRGGAMRGGGGAPRAAAPRASAPAPRLPTAGRSSPALRSSRSAPSAPSRAASPQPAPRVGPTAGGRASGGQRVLSGGQRSGSTPTVARTGTEFRGRGSPAADAPRGGRPVLRGGSNTAPRATPAATAGRDTPDRAASPGFRGGATRGAAPADAVRGRAPIHGRSGALPRTGGEGRDGSAGALPPTARGNLPGFDRRTDGTLARKPGTGVSPDTYRSAWKNGRRVAPAGRDVRGGGGKGGDGNGNGHHHHHDGCHDSYHDYYDHGGWYLSFSFGAAWGPYYGVSYYRPWHSWNLGCDYAFFYPAPVAYAYVPYGFYVDTTPVYVTRYEVIRESVPRVEVVERVVYAEEEIEDLGPAAGPAPAPGADPKVADPRPAAASPATEKFLREASEEFRAKRYYEAAVKFRLAALADPEQPGPLFALGQSLIAMGEDAYAARVLRKAIALEPRMLGETGDLVGVWESRAEFDRVLAALEARAAAAPADGDARFLLAVERYFTGDPRCREDLEALHAAHPKDGAVALLRGAVGSRFKAPDDLPAIPGAPAK